MESKSSSSWFFFIVISIIVARSVIIIFSVDEVVASVSIPETYAPKTISIPSIGITAPIEFIGLLSGGELDVPKIITNAGWFKGGPRPGEKGNAIIDGHYGWRDHIPTVFDNLNTIQVGDKIYITNEKGSVMTFVATEIKVFGEKESAVNIFTSHDDKAHLNLITCEGIWNKVEQSYSGRLVVFADKEV